MAVNPRTKPKGATYIRRGLGEVIPDIGERTRVGRTHFFHTPVTVRPQSLEIRPATPSRIYLLIENRSSAALFLNFDSPASAETGIEIVAGGNYELDRELVPDNALHMSVAGSVNQRINITEGIRTSL